MLGQEVPYFIENAGTCYRVVIREKDYCWVICYDTPAPPFCVTAMDSSVLHRVPTPEDFLKEIHRETLSVAAQKHLLLIQPLLDAGADVIRDKTLRYQMAKQIAEAQGTTARRVLRLYYRYLARGELVKGKPREATINPTFDWAIVTMYYSAKRLSLRATYDMMLVQKFERDATERWATDYRSQGILNLQEFTKILIYAVIYLNAGRLLANGETPAQRWLMAEPDLLTVPPEELHLMALPKRQIKLTRKGFRLNGIFYAPEKMGSLSLGSTYTIAIDAEKLDAVYVVPEGYAYLG